MADDSHLESSYRLRSDADTRRHYDDWAATYDAELAANEYAQPQRCAAALIGAGIAIDAPVLDVGCGTGLSGAALAAAGYRQIDGCDLSPEMLRVAGELDVYRHLFEANLNEPFPLGDATYDAVTAVGVFSFGHIRAEALEEVCRIVRPGGAIVIGTNDRFHREGTVSRKLDELAMAGRVRDVRHEHGEHLPGFDMTGWVLTALVT